MRHRRVKPTPVQSKVIMMSGGLKEDVSQLELKGGDLIGCQNYQTVDGIFHGYSSVAGYERFDGQTRASLISAPTIEDNGSEQASLCLESGSFKSGTKDYGFYNNSFTLSANILEDTNAPKFGLSEFYFTDALSTITIPHQEQLNVNPGSFTVDFLAKIVNPTLDADIMEKDGCWRIRMIADRLVFAWSYDGINFADSVSSGTLLQPSIRYHIAIMQIGDVIKIFVDGIEDAVSSTLSGSISSLSTADLILGGGFKGWLDQIRVMSKYMWYENFAIPTKEYSTTGYYEVVTDDQAREAQRDIIMEVPGEGPVLAVGVLDGIVGAVRNEVGGAQSQTFASTPTGWAGPIPGAPILHFDNGKDNSDIGFLEGDVITGSVSGASATILHHNLHHGLWTGGETADGVLVLDTISNPPFVAADELSNGTGVTANIKAGTDAEDTFELAPDGEYEVLIASFDLLDGNQREKIVFNVNGVNEPYYFNGGMMIPIIHPNLPDHDTVFATHIADFKNRLWLAYPDGRLWYSGVGDPYEWDTATGGAGEIYLEDEITSMIVGPGDVLIVFCRNSTQIIKTIADAGAGVTASTVADYAFFNETFSKRSGALPYTTERLLGDVYFLDDRGLTSMSATDTYGDFGASAISKNVQRRLINKRDQTVTSALQRESNQYRLFFDDKSGFTFTFDEEKKIKGITQTLYKHQITCFAEGEELNGDLLIAFGCDDGYVRLMDSGTSFDGEDIETFLTPAFYSYGSPTDWKRFLKVTFEMQAASGLTVSARPDYNYREKGMPKSVQQNYELYGSGGVYGSDAWGSFRWSGGTDTPLLYLTGYGTNMSLTLSTRNKYTQPHTINSIIVEYSRHARKM